MAFKVKAKVLEAARAAGGPKQTIWEEAKSAILANLTISIAEAEGYLEKPMADPKPSKNWKVKNIGRGAQRVTGLQLFVKVSNRSIPGFFDGDDSVVLEPHDALSTLKEMWEYIEGMNSKDFDENSKKIHEAALGAKTARLDTSKKRYNPETDMIEKI
jgi:hypothetical protein